MSVLQGYEPAAVLGFFEDISAIPHISGDERAIADYIENFARARGLFCCRDEVNNVFVRLPATEGHESAPAVMLQGHTDMVGEKDAASPHNFAVDPLRLRVVESDGASWIAATGTTLGGDDGIAVAMMLAILDCPPEPHPAVECLFTVSEETGLEGAWAFDPVRAGATATTLINLDSEAEGVVTAGCSGGMRTDIRVPVVLETVTDADLSVVDIALSGLSGGHSGVEIHEGHTNAIKLLGRLLREVEGMYDIRLLTLSGGGKDNAIPRDARASVTVARADASALCHALCEAAEKVRREPHFIAADKSFTCTATLGGEVPPHRFTAATHRAALSALNLVRDGVLSMSAHVKGLVAYSRNLGILETDVNESGEPCAVSLSFSTRSASGTHLDDAARELDELAAVLSTLAEGQVVATHRARYPGWDYAPVSPLRDRWLAASAEMYGFTPRIEVIHAGLECGILSDKLTAACGVSPDIISIGPDMRDIHTPREMLSIPSAERTYRLLCRVIGSSAHWLDIGCGQRERGDQSAKRD